MDKTRLLYFANMWRGLISRGSVCCLQKKGYQVDGNWINNIPPNSKRYLYVYSPAQFNSALSPAQLNSDKIINFLLFPDELIGWDTANKKYKSIPNSRYKECLQKFPILSHSQYSLDLIRINYSTLNTHQSVIYLPIDSRDIRHSIRKMKGSNKKLSVLWWHMWRSDKGFIEAIRIIDRLSSKYKNVTFTIGRSEKWGVGLDVDKIKSQSRQILKKLRSKSNVVIKKQCKQANSIEYLQLLADHQIGFSTAYHEGFGISMLEQAASGMACVLPNREVYPELNAGYIVEDVEMGIMELIENSEKRKMISNKSQERAMDFDYETWTEEFSKIIEHHI